MSAFSAQASLSIEPPTNHGSNDFDELDDALLVAVPGVLVVRVPDGVSAPILAHVARRLRAVGCSVVEPATGSTTSIFREAMTELGLGSTPCSASAYADALVTRPRVAVVARLPREGSWDDAVLHELAARKTAILVFATSSAPPPYATSTFEVTALTDRGKVRWLEAVVGESASLRERDLRGLESWWRRARGRIDEGPTFERPILSAAGESSELAYGLSARAREVATCLALARRSLPLSSFGLVRVDDAVIEELYAAHVVTDNRSALVLDPSVDVARLEARATREMRELTASVLLSLVGSGNGDPWASARAAELLLEDDPRAADEAMDRAVRSARDARVLAEIDDAWFQAVASAGGSNGLELRLHGAERALATSRPNDALRWCASVPEIGALEPKILVATAKAQIQIGDLVSARVILERIHVESSDAELSARIAVERGEIAYLSGDHAEAASEVERVLARTVSEPVRLAARNVLGKVLLARGQWDAADAHFASDALAARSVGDVTAELRARVNRGIALLSKGLLDEARQMLLGVLEDGERFGLLQATMFALANLGVTARRQRDYVAALHYWEEVMSRCDGRGGWVAPAHTIGNLAELRLMLGRVDGAEHAILFGQRMLAGKMTPLRAAQFKLMAARVALARGLTEAARDEIEHAMVHARASGDVESAATVAVVGVRVALSDGDVRRAEEWLRAATDYAKTARAIAEVALVRAMHVRAMGRPALDAANDALASARAASDDDLLLDVYALAAACARDEDDDDSARAHCSRALSIRERIAATLGPDARELFLSKPEMLELSRLHRALAEAREGTDLHDGSAEGRSGPSVASRRPDTREIVGADPKMRSLDLALRRAALSDSPILIFGESGTGKELVARAVHAASTRSSGPLVVVNCAAFVESLLLSELFGHEKGAFTGATSRRRGRFELADGGTLFLDEIGDISPRAQVALLRVLQEKVFERIGGTTTLQSNVRVVCATHRDLRKMVECGAFREDLYYRVRGVTLEVPPLRARTGDIPMLADHLLTRIASEHRHRPKKLAADAIDLLLRHRWPGNVRELENVLRAAVVFAERDTITLADVLDAVRDLRPVTDPPPPPRAPISRPPPSSLESGPLERAAPHAPLPAAVFAHVREHRVSLHHMKREIERECVARALDESNGNITRAAELLGMKRPRVSQLAKQYGLTSNAQGE